MIRISTVSFFLLGRSAGGTPFVMYSAVAVEKAERRRGRSGKYKALAMEVNKNTHSSRIASSSGRLESTVLRRQMISNSTIPKL
ncbi:hypothetical protein RJ639_003736 [Escallonia herrerae]|uniref:Secreted protein n=1 Tax=Escallonia herrerae TaxID=1293975 RepID=A0AA88W0S2_9ASTE|nr:hypothetical protein RJ639_003736 [Escallonia herrerae]